MSDYGYDDHRRHRSTRTRDPEYVTETTYIQRGQGQPSRELVYRSRDDSIEDIPRDFPPGTEYRRTKIRDEYGPRRTRSVGHRDPYEDDYSYVGPGAAGAAAGYAAGRSRGRGGREDDYYSDYEPQRRERRKSKVGEVLEGLGLGGVAAAVMNRSRSRSRHRGDNRSRSGDRGDRGHDRSHETRKKWQQAAQAALIAGATEAIRSRKEPGPWTGPKGQRIATAAFGAAGIDGLLDRNPHEKSKRHVLESVLGGLAATRITQGPRSRSNSRGRDDSRGRSRSRSLSRARSFLSRSKSRGRSNSRGIKELAAAGGVAAVGKAIYDRVRSKSRGRARSHSSGSNDSFVPSRRNQYNDNRARF